MEMARTPGRPRKYREPRVRVAIEMPAKIVDILDSIAWESETTRTELINRFVEEGIECLLGDRESTEKSRQ